jgi:hypothetical protein
VLLFTSIANSQNPVIILKIEERENSKLLDFPMHVPYHQFLMQTLPQTKFVSAPPHRALI